MNTIVNVSNVTDNEGVYYSNPVTTLVRRRPRFTPYYYPCSRSCQDCCDCCCYCMFCDFWF
ncbi:hypothetical protein ESZ91_07685 [Candidatus Borkfalkia ceftriaxoniphila]|uniref:Uncharacterized protein n=1 Tax=Candidatus Borkfalkia ceftriaxoniphila TaxID=2508949 RepID=A0A4Q2KCG0_9FIRM|nr:hypothetical protein [Candidatus Borkfalkia ceftriaxoniphila]RXZ62265.1 hypothetical protein ESZ91_07685 [Candidatus Borkfalkia ceftriaxoniphila]